MTRWEIAGIVILIWLILCGTFCVLWARFWNMIKGKEKPLTPAPEARDDPILR